MLISSSDGFCSCLVFASGELGTQYQTHLPPQRPLPAQISTAASPHGSTPSQTPTQPNVPHIPRPPSAQSQQSPYMANHPASPARSMSISSVTTQELFASMGDQSAETRAANSQTPQISSVPSITAASPLGPSAGGLPMFTPPQTPGNSMVGAIGPPTGLPASVAAATSAPQKREADASSVTAQPQEKKRRIQPTLISGGDKNDTVQPGSNG